MSHDHDQVAKIRAFLRSGRLPDQLPSRVWAGFGPGTDRCEACSALIPAGQVVMEAVFGADESRSLFFHRECFSLVEAEWQEKRPVPTGTEAAPSNAE